jgi:hypothetical protein
MFTKLNLLVITSTFAASIGTGAIAVGSLESELLKTAASSGIMGLLLLWFVYTARQNQLRDQTESLARETRLADRLSKLEDEMRNKLIVTLKRVDETLDDFKQIVEACQKHATL